MAILVTADGHLIDQARERYRFAAMEFISDCIEKYKVDTLIVLGDLTHNKNHHSDTLVNDVVEVLYQFSRLCEVVVLQGNHDYVEADTAFFYFVRLLKNVQWIRQTVMKRIEGLGLCCFLPHTRDYEKDWAGIKQVWADANLIFAHNSFEGAVGENGRKLPGIPLSVFPEGIPIISGDIHKPQAIGMLTYVGAPYRQKYGDDFEPRLLLLNNGGMETIPVPGPQKQLFDITDLNELKKLRYADGDMLKVRYHLPTSERERWPEIKKKIQRVCENALIQPVLETQSLGRPVVRSKLRDDKQLVQDYGRQQNLSAEMLDTGVAFLDEA